MHAVKKKDNERSCVPQQLEDGKHNVVDVAKARCFIALGVMQTACPIDGNVTVAAANALRSTCKVRMGQTCGALVPMEPPAEMEQYSKIPSNTGQSSPTLTASSGLVKNAVAAPYTWPCASGTLACCRG
jgi:hypothetical protein